MKAVYRANKGKITMATREAENHRTTVSVPAVEKCSLRVQPEWRLVLTISTMRIEGERSQALKEELEAPCIEFEGRVLCLGREVLETSATAEAASKRQLKTEKCTYPNCTRGEFIPLLARVEAPLGEPMLPRSRWRPGMWPGIRPRLLSRQRGAAR